MANHMNHDLNPNRVSNFVTLAFSGAFCDMLALHAAFELSNESLRTDLANRSARSRPSCCLLLMSTAAWRLCASACVTDAESLDDLLRDVHRYFNLADACHPELRECALELLEHCLAIATESARQALDEALSGFPVSEGNFARWTEAQLLQLTDS